MKDINLNENLHLSGNRLGEAYARVQAQKAEEKRKLEEEQKKLEELENQVYVDDMVEDSVKQPSFLKQYSGPILATITMAAAVAYWIHTINNVDRRFIENNKPEPAPTIMAGTDLPAPKYDGIAYFLDENTNGYVYANGAWAKIEEKELKVGGLLNLVEGLHSKVDVEKLKEIESEINGLRVNAIVQPGTYKGLTRISEAPAKEELETLTRVEYHSL